MIVRKNLISFIVRRWFFQKLSRMNCVKNESETPVYCFRAILVELNHLLTLLSYNEKEERNVKQRESGYKYSPLRFSCAVNQTCKLRNLLFVLLAGKIKAQKVSYNLIFEE